MPALQAVLAPVDPMARVHRLVDAAASDDSPAFLAGETGSGKGYQAGRIHTLSARAAAPFIHVFAATLGPDAFDPAALSSVVASARGGVLFVDEVEELSAAAQARMYRYIEAQARRSVPDVRVIVSTTCDLDSLAAASHRFRRDLFFCLAALMIVLPPLRARRGEIGVLARSFIGEAAARVGRLPPTLTMDAEDALLAYAWPGNVRQLRSVLTAATIGAHDGVLRRDALWLPAPSFDTAPVEPSPALPTSEDAPESTSRVGRRALDRARIVDALARAGGNQSVAALDLGISRRTLINRIEQYGLPRPRKT